MLLGCYLFFFFNDTATPEIYTLSLHAALPISADQRGPSWSGGPHLRRRRPDGCRDPRVLRDGGRRADPDLRRGAHRRGRREDRKSTRLNSSHANISYAVFCLKKKRT